MKKNVKVPPRISHLSLRLIVAYCLVLTLLPLWGATAQAQGKGKKKKPVVVANIKLELDKDAILRPGEQLTIRATPVDKNETPIPGVKVEWKFASDSSAEFAVLGQPLNTKTAHENTLTGRNPPKGSQDIPTEITVRAMVGDTFREIPVRYKASSQSANNVINFKFSPAKPDKLSPGESYEIIAEVVDAAGQKLDAEVSWLPIAPEQKDFVLLSKSIDDKTPNKITVSGKAKKSNNPPKLIVVAASYGNAFKMDSIPYEQSVSATPPPASNPNEAKVNDIEIVDKDITDPRASKELEVEPGRRLRLKATAKDENGKDVTGVKISWTIPEDMTQFIAQLPPEKKDEFLTEPVFFGLAPKSDVRRNDLFGETDKAPEFVSLLAEVGNVTKVVNIRYGRPEVDVSWNVMPNEVVKKNYGSNVSDNFYCVEVAIGNNSGNDLQLSGLSFDLPKLNSQGQHASNLYAGMRLPVASYDVVRGMSAQRKFSFNRTTLINGLEAVAQFLTGFNPFFHVASHARNFSQGINILGNPITKGLERLWPDPYQDELNRLEQQTLHDDKIIANQTVYKTRVFFPKNALKDTDDKFDANNLTAVRERLGHLVLVGSRLSRGDFQLRVKQGFRSEEFR